MKEVLAQLQADVAGITKAMAEKVTKSESEVKELADKLQGVMKEQSERKHQYETTTALSLEGRAKREVEEKMDELFIASVILTSRKSGELDRGRYAEVAKQKDYAIALDRVKASGFNFGGLDSVTTAGQSEAAIPPGFSATMLEDIFLTLKVANLFGRITMPTPSFTFGIAVDRFSARLTGEKLAPTKDNLNFDDIIFTAKKLMATIDYTDEMDADAIAAMLPYIRKRLVDSFGLAQEKIVLNGATNSNIFNGIADTEDATYLTDGIRKLEAARNVDFAGAFTETLLHNLREKLGNYGIDPSKLAYVMSMADYLKCLTPGLFPNYQALHTYGQNAIVLKGELARIAGIPIVVTELLPKNLDAAGIYNVAGTKKTCGLIYTDAYLFGDRKQFGLETFRNPYSQFTSLIGSERLDFKKVVSASATTAAFGVNY